MKAATIPIRELGEDIPSTSPVPTPAGTHHINQSPVKVGRILETRGMITVIPVTPEPEGPNSVPQPATQPVKPIWEDF